MAHKAYHGGSFFDAVGRKLDTIENFNSIVNADVLDAWFDPAPQVMSALTAHLPFLLKTSPPTHCEGLVEVISEVRKINPERIITGGGSSDLIFLFFQHTPGKTLILDPMYGEYSFLLETVQNREVVRHMLDKNKDFAFHPTELADTIRDWNPEIVALVNPNSPTGKHCPKDDLLSVINEFPNVTFVVDEAYVDYVGREHSLEREELDNLVVIKSMSKVYALSGVRAAYMVAPQVIVDNLSPHNPPWPVSGPGQLAAMQALQNQDYYDQRYLQTRELKEKLVADLKDVGRIVNGCANFVLIELDKPVAQEVADKCRDKGVFIRNCDSMSKQFNGRFIRIAVKTEEQNKRIVETLKDALHA